MFQLPITCSLRENFITSFIQFVSEFLLIIDDGNLKVLLLFVAE